MPSKTAKQARYMAMCASDKGRAKAKGDCPPKSVAREFYKSDRMRAERRTRGKKRDR